MEIGWTILYTIDILLFIIVSITVLYFTVFSFASLFSQHKTVPSAKRFNRFIILIPSYKKDDNIIETVKSILGQTYPERLFDITVISDHQKEITNFKLAQYPITLLTPNFKNSSKARSLQLAINNLPQFKIYDVVIILDAGSLVEPEFLQQMNDAFEIAGTKAIQAHRLSKNRDTAIAHLDAIFEEINNSVFRRGHITLGISAAISGSGVAYDYKWFANNITKVKTAGEDKEIESLLMRQRIFIDYFDNIFVYDEKTRGSQEFKEQRSRWVATQLKSILSNIKYLPAAIISKRYDFVDKILQWMLVPRTIMVCIIAFMSIILPFIYLSIAIKWWLLFAFILFVFAMATPDYLVDKNWNKTFYSIPKVVFSSIISRLTKKTK